MFDPERYVQALRFAAERHRDQRVPGTDLPYLVHVTSVAAEVIAAVAHARDPDLAITCALLHDTIEDTATTYDEVAATFGKPTADGVAALTKNAELPKHERMTDSLRRILAQPREIAMVKLADRITNLAPPPRGWTPEKCRAYRIEAIEIADTLGAACAPLAARLRSRVEHYAAYC